MTGLLQKAQAKIDAAYSARSPDAPRDHVVLLTAATSIKPEPIMWLWLHWLARGKLHLLAGAPGQGKTTLAAAITAVVSCGGIWPDGQRCEPGNVLFWSGEDDPADTLIPRLIAMGADLAHVFFIKATRVDGEVLPFDPARDMGQLAAAAEGIGNVCLIVVDPIVSAVAGDSHKNTEVRRGLQPLVDLAASLGAAVLGISHLSKGTAGRDPTERVTGSIAFTAVVRVVLLAAKVKGDDGKDRRILVRSKSNIGPDEGGFEYHLEQTEAVPGIPASIVSWGQAIEGTARELLAEAEADPGAADTQASSHDADDALKRILGGDWVPMALASDDMKAAGFSPKQTRTARERIGVIVRRSGFGKDMKTHWRLPDGIALPADEAPVMPGKLHSCPLMPTQIEGTNGQEWETAGMTDADAEAI